MKKIYGIRFDPAQNRSPERTGDAKGLCYRQQTADDCQRSDFDDCYPWSQMKECNLSPDGNVVFVDEEGFSRAKNTFIRVPAFYFKRTVQDGVEEWLISGYPHEGFLPEPWFVNADGTVSPYRYIAKYEGCAFENGEVSVSGKPHSTRRIRSASPSKPSIGAVCGNTPALAPKISTNFGAE